MQFGLDYKNKEVGYIPRNIGECIIHFVFYEYIPMKNYQKILRRLISHPSYALEIIRSITSRERAVCKKCGVIRRCQIHHKDKRGVVYFYCPDCKQTYSELYGTIFYRSKIPPGKWCRAILEWIISTGSISAAELSRRIEVKHETAWRMLMKIREKLFASNLLDHDLLKDIVEADEAWFGKKENQQIVFGLIERTTKKLRLFIVPNVKESTLYRLIEKNVKRYSKFFTDSYVAYHITNLFYEHKTTNHSKKEYARGIVHSNTIEHIWGDIKGIIRTIHHGISKKYRHLYLAQYVFKKNHEKTSNLFYSILCQLIAPMFAGI